MAKSLRAVAKKSFKPFWPGDEPTDGLSKLHGKAFMDKHPGVATGDANGNGDEVFKASNVKKAPFPRADEEENLDEMSPGAYRDYKTLATGSRVSLRKQMGKILKKPDTPEVTKEFKKVENKHARRGMFIRKASKHLGEGAAASEMGYRKHGAPKMRSGISLRSDRAKDTRTFSYGKGDFAKMGKDLAKQVYRKTKKESTDLNSIKGIKNHLSTKFRSKEELAETVTNHGVRLVSKPHHEKGHKAFDVFFNDQYLGSIHSYTAKPHNHGVKELMSAVGGGKVKKVDMTRWFIEPKNEDGQLYRKPSSSYKKEYAIDRLKDHFNCYEETVAESIRQKSLVKGRKQKTGVARKRSDKGIAAKAQPFRKPRMRKEEALDEVSTDTLNNYVDRGKDHFYSLKHKEQKYGRLSKTNDRLKNNRRRGLVRATKRLHAEENLDELTGKGNLEKIERYHSDKSQQYYDKANGLKRGGRAIYRKRGEQHDAKSSRAADLIDRRNAGSDLRFAQKELARAKGHAERGRAKVRSLGK